MGSPDPAGNRLEGDGLRAGLDEKVARRLKRGRARFLGTQTLATIHSHATNPCARERQDRLIDTNVSKGYLHKCQFKDPIR